MMRATVTQTSAARDRPPPIAAAACFQSPSVRQSRTPLQIHKRPASPPLRIEFHPMLRTIDLSSELRALSPRGFSFQLIEEFFAMRPQCANHVMLYNAAP